MGARFNQAMTAAADLHRGQFRKGTDIPYVSHLLGVAGIALDYGADEDEAIAALLHDAIEDAPEELGADWVRRWVAFTFGGRVLAIIEACTDADRNPKPPWQARKELYVSHIAQKDASAILVSAADKLHNARAILADFNMEGPSVFARFSAGPDAVVSYYRGLTDAFAERCATLDERRRARIRQLVNELERVVAAIEAASGITGRWPYEAQEL